MYRYCCMYYYKSCYDDLLCKYCRCLFVDCNCCYSKCYILMCRLDCSIVLSRGMYNIYYFVYMNFVDNFYCIVMYILDYENFVYMNYNFLFFCYKFYFCNFVYIWIYSIGCGICCFCKILDMYYLI